MKTPKPLKFNLNQKLNKILQAPQKEDNKYTRGQCIIASGPVNMSGAAILAARAASFCGVGIVKLVADDTTMPVLASSIPDAVKLYYAEFPHFITQIDIHHSAMLIGPGGVHPIHFEEILARICKLQLKTILDAGALTYFSGNPEGLSIFTNNNMIITPHEGEFAKLFPELVGSKVNRALAAAKMLDCTVILKGNDTVIALSDGTHWVHKNAPTCLATAGSGDVLAGIICALLAKGADPFDAAAIGVSIHAKCVGEAPFNITALDIIEYLKKFVARIL